MIKKLPEAVSSDDSDNYNMSKTDDNSTIIDASSHGTSLCLCVTVTCNVN